MTAEFLVDSIDGLTDSGTISKEFVGVILLPIVGNAAGMSDFRNTALICFAHRHDFYRACHSSNRLSQGQAYSQPGSRCRLEYCE